MQPSTTTHDNRKQETLQTLLNHATNHDHPQPAITLPSQPQPPRTSHNLAANNHKNPQPAIILL